MWETHLQYPGYGFDFYGSENYLKTVQEYGNTFSGVFKYLTTNLTHNPVAIVTLYFRKLLYLFSNFEIPQNYNYYLFRSFSRILSNPLSNFSIFSVYGFFGFLFLLKAERSALKFLVFGTGLAFILGIIPFYNCDRFRLPLTPYLMILTAFSFFEIRSRIIKPKTRPFAMLVLLFSGFLLWALKTPEVNAGYRIRYTDYNSIGVAYEFSPNLNNFEKAETYYQQAIALASNRGAPTGDLRKNILRLLRKAGEKAWKDGEMEQSFAIYDRYLAIDRDSPFSAIAHLRTGFIFYQRQDCEKAIPALEKALSFNQNEPRGHLLLGFCLEKNEPDKSMLHFAKAWKLDRNNVKNFLPRRILSRLEKTIGRE